MSGGRVDTSARSEAKKQDDEKKFISPQQRSDYSVIGIWSELKTNAYVEFRVTFQDLIPSSLSPWITTPWEQNYEHLAQTSHSFATLSLRSTELANPVILSSKWATAQFVKWDLFRLRHIQSIRGNEVIEIGLAWRAVA